jgi:hypothetical protein
VVTASPQSGTRKSVQRSESTEVRKIAVLGSRYKRYVRHQGRTEGTAVRKIGRPAPFRASVPSVVFSTCWDVGSRLYLDSRCPTRSGVKSRATALVPAIPERIPERIPESVSIVYSSRSRVFRRRTRASALTESPLRRKRRPHESGATERGVVRRATGSSSERPA